MARITLRQLLDHAAEHSYGVPAFNINNMEQGLAILEAAKATDSPVIIQASRGARTYANDIMLAKMMEALASSGPSSSFCRPSQPCSWPAPPGRDPGRGSGRRRAVGRTRAGLPGQQPRGGAPRAVPVRRRGRAVPAGPRPRPLVCPGADQPRHRPLVRARRDRGAAGSGEGGGARPRRPAAALRAGAHRPPGEPARGRGAVLPARAGEGPERRRGRREPGPGAPAAAPLRRRHPAAGGGG